jgi:HEPN domain-containing protein
MFYKHFQLGMEMAESDSDHYKLASFHLHQATEKLYMTILLVFTEYKPKTHNLSKLGMMTCNEDKRFSTVFPTTTAEEERMFKLLKSAYIDSRYNHNFKITKEELEYLSGRVEVLRELTEKICKEKIEYYKSKV